MERTLKPENGGHTCAQCRYWSVYTNLESRQQTPICRRNAPTVTSQAIPMTNPSNPKEMGIAWQHTTFWPIVQSTDWCGEFQVKRDLNS